MSQPTKTNPESGRQWNVGDAALADRLHSAAIQLLRALRTEDRGSGISGPRLSALSVLVFGGERTISRLAQAEQVSVPTISRLIKDMERDGLVRRAADQSDLRISRISPTARGRQLLEAGRARRVNRLDRALSGLVKADRKKIEQAVLVLESIMDTGEFG